MRIKIRKTYQTFVTKRFFEPGTIDEMSTASPARFAGAIEAEVRFRVPKNIYVVELDDNDLDREDMNSIKRAIQSVLSRPE